MPNATGPLVPRTINYTYDSASRLTGATYYPNLTGSGSPLYNYSYTYDWSGNRLTETLSGTTRSFGYNAANQLITQGSTTLTYDRNGNLLSDGTNTYVWDRANRLLSMGGVSYAYDADNDRYSRTAGGQSTNYVLDKQSALTLVLSEVTSGATTRYLHGPTGIFGQQSNAQAAIWGTTFLLQDGLGSVRAMSDGTNVVTSQAYSPYGEPLQADMPTGFGFTGEQTDPVNDLVYLRTRYLSPQLGIFIARDPFEGQNTNALSLNRYLWVNGNPANYSDAKGLYPCASADGDCLPSIPNGIHEIINDMGDIVGPISNVLAFLNDTYDTYKWVKDFSKFLGPIDLVLMRYEALSDANAAWEAGDYIGMIYYGSKLVPGYGEAVDLGEEILKGVASLVYSALDRSKATLPPQHNREYTRCLSGFGATFRTPEQNLAALYASSCESAHYQDYMNPGVCSYPSDAQIKSGLETIDALQAAGMIPDNLSGATYQEIEQYSNLITISDPYSGTLGSSGGLWGTGSNRGQQGMEPRGLAGVGTLATFLLLTRSLQNHPTTDTRAFQSILSASGHPVGSRTPNFNSLVNSLKDGEWMNVANCSFNH